MVKYVRFFQDPIDGETFKNRDDCFQHMVKQGHGGAPMSIEEVKVEKVKKITTAKTKIKGLFGRSREKPFHCKHINCKYQGNTIEALKTHQKAKNHKGYQKMNESGVILSQTVTAAKEEVQPKVAEKPKDTRGVVQKELEDSFEENYGRPYDIFIRITDESYALIEKEIPKGIEHHDQTGNHLIFIPKGLYRQFDYLMSQYDFVEIEMEIKDVIYAMAHWPIIEDSEEGELISWDMAEYREMNIVGISDVGGCFVVDYKATSPKLLVADAIKTLSNFEDSSKLACVGGMWQYVYSAANNPTTPHTAKKGKTNLTSKGISQRPESAAIARHRSHQTQLGSQHHFQHHSEEYRTELVKESEYRHIGGNSWNSAPSKSSYPREPRWHPVYGISQGLVIIDRVIDYLKVYYPNKK